MMDKQKKKLLFVSVYPKATVDFLSAAYFLQNFALKNEKIKKNINFETYNIRAGQALEQIEKINNANFDYIAFPCYLWNIQEIINFCEKLQNKNTLLMFGGPEISEDKTNSFKNIQNPKIFMIGEGEDNFNDILIQLIDKKAIDTNSVITSHQRFLADKEIPVIYDENFPTELIRFKEVPIETQRGCPFKCSYCNYTKGFEDIRYYPLEKILKELEYIIQNDPREIRFIDPVFTSDKKRAVKILNYILEKTKDNTPLIYVESDVYSLDSELINIFAKFKSQNMISNYSEIVAKDEPQYFTEAIQNYNFITTIGIQSFNKASLNAVNRVYVSPNKFKEFIKECNSKNIVLKIDTIFGLPYETLESYFEGMNILIKELENTDNFLEIHNLRTIPNTKLYSDKQLFNLKDDNNTNSVIGTNSLTSEDFFYGKQITALIFRIINSPLRNNFINKCNKINKNYIDVIIFIHKILKDKNLLPQKMQDKNFTDEYWAKDIFKEIKTTTLSEIIDSLNE